MTVALTSFWSSIKLIFSRISRYENVVSAKSVAYYLLYPSERYQYSSNRVPFSFGKLSSPWNPPHDEIPTRRTRPERTCSRRCTGPRTGSGLAIAQRWVDIADWPTVFLCLLVTVGQEPACDCLHNTCGPNCDRCCPMFNQRPWKAGPAHCEQCQCHGHATECQYDPIVEEERSSLDIYGTYSGGGICINCSVSKRDDLSLTGVRGEGGESVRHASSARRRRRRLSPDFDDVWSNGLFWRTFF